MSVDLIALKAELDADPLARGYAAMSDAQASASLNTLDRQKARALMSTDEILQSIVFSEFKALQNADKDNVRMVLSLGSVDPRGRAADIFVDAFGGASATITALQAARLEPASRVQELDIAPGVTPSDVADARRL